MTSRVLVTGGSGFVARALLSTPSPELEYLAASRRRVELAGVQWRPCPDLGPAADWKALLDGVDCVVHLAGRAHVRIGADRSPYFTENCDGTAKLARDASSCGVRRFVYLSSAKVSGEESGPLPLNEDAVPRPGDAYAASKLAAEEALRALGGDMQVAILRPPLVYGPGVKANFLALLSAVGRGVPMPLSAIRNRRSLIGVDNLASAIRACLQLPAAAGRTYHVTDGPAVSTPQLVRAIASAMGRSARLFPIPPRMLELCGALLGRGGSIRRLTRSLELDDRAIRSELGWRPPCSFAQEILATTRWFQSPPEPAARI